MGNLRITQIRSAIGRPKDQKATLKALGLRRMQQSVDKQDIPQIRGMVVKISHMVSVEEIPDESKGRRPRKAGRP